MSCFRIWGDCPDPPETRTETYSETKVRGPMVVASLIGWGTTFGFLIAGFTTEVAVAPPPARTGGQAAAAPDFQVKLSKGF